MCFTLSHKKIIAIALVCVCALGGIKFLAEHQQSATENTTSEVLTDENVSTEDTSELAEEDSTNTETSESTEEVVETTESSTEVASGDTETTEEVPATTEEISETAQDSNKTTEVPTSDDLNEIGVTTGDTYEYSY